MLCDVIIYFYLKIRWNEIITDCSNNHKFDVICARNQQVLEGYEH